MYDPAKYQQRYLERKAAGLCVNCGSPAMEGHVQCQVCRQRITARYHKVKGPELTKATRTRKLKRLYQITPEEYEVALRKQNGLCGICGGPPTGKSSFHVDHNHESGLFRGVLCLECNVQLGTYEKLLRTNKVALFDKYLGRTDAV